MTRSVELFDTTLRDGSQMQGISLTVDDKIHIAQRLDALGINYIEGGWPGSNPKDEEFFARAKKELKLAKGRLVAFSSTRRANSKVAHDPIVRALVESETPVACIVGKSWDIHVTEALRTTVDENVAMVSETIAYLKKHFDEVLFDAEHFFDGFKNSPDYAMRVITAAAEAGADVVVLCDTNGGTLPHEVAETVAVVADKIPGRIGVHCHDDCGVGVANSLAGILAGAVHVQGTMNGYGERCGNANLVTVAANLSLKMGFDTSIKPDRLTETAHYVAEVCNRALNVQAPFVGTSAFAHKAGLHASAIAKRSDLYEHIDPSVVGNLRHMVVSELAGRSTIVIKAAELGVEVTEERTLQEVLKKVKELEHLGYHFEAADGSFELLLRRATGWDQEFFRIESFRTITETTPDGDVVSEATVKLHARGRRIISTGEGNGPVNALDDALRAALMDAYPDLAKIHLTDYKVRILNEAGGTAATTRVLLESSDGQRDWGTIGVSGNVIEASWEALIDSYVYGLLHRP